MPIDQPFAAGPPGWYLIALEGDMVLKLSDSLDIGEDEAGELMLNPDNGGLVRLTLTGDELWAQVLALDLTLTQNGNPSVQHLVFRRGETVRLQFPSNALTIASEFIPGKPLEADRVVSFLPTSPPTLALERLREPIIIVEEPTASAGPQASGTEESTVLLDAIGDDPDGWPAGIPSDVPDEEADAARPLAVAAGEPATAPDPATPEDALTSPIIAAEPTGEPSTGAIRDEAPTPQGDRRARRRFARWLLILLVVGAAVLIPLQWGDHDLGVLTSPAMEALESLLGYPAEEAAPGSAATEARLMEAESLLASGAIIAPREHNAVQLLKTILREDPGNERAQQLLTRCATRLLSRARSARSAGDDEAARSQLEAVLEFHPGFEPARQLLAIWYPDRPGGN